jgi:hypothetical protein
MSQAFKSLQQMKLKHQLQALHTSPITTTASTEQQAEWTPRAGVGNDANRIRILSLTECVLQLWSLAPITSSFTELQTLLYKGIRALKT